MNRTIQISERWAGRRALVRISGRILTGAAAGRLLLRVRAALARGIRELTIDLADLAAIDCGGIGVLLLCFQDASRHGATLRVTRSRGPIRTMLALSSLLSLLEEGGLPGKESRRAGQDAPLLATA